jgi:drug/metabolite transporter (DMT)-like permease
MMSAKNWVQLLILSLLWGGSFFFVEVALQGLPVLTIVWCRVAIAALLLALACMFAGTPLPRGGPIWRALLVMGFLNNAVPFTLFALAQGQISGSLAAILNATTPLFTVIVAHVFTSDERAGTAKVMGLALGFSGVVVMMAGGGEAGVWFGPALCLMAALSYGMAGVWGRRFRRMGVAPLATAFGQVTASSVLLVPIWLAVDQPWSMVMPSVHVALAVVGIATLSTALAYLLYFRLLSSAGATNLSLVTFLIPVSATMLGVMFLEESLLPRHVVGFGLISLGLVAIDGRLLQRRVV